MASKPSFKRRSTARLLSDWAAIMRELRRRGAIRSENNPTGDLAEALVAEFYGVEPEANSTAGYDLRLSDGTRVQVKGRRRTRRSKPSHYGLIRKLDQGPFDVLVVVNLDEEFAVESAFRMPIDVVRELAGFSTHTNAWRLPIIQGSRAAHPGVEQITLGPQQLPKLRVGGWSVLSRRHGGWTGPESTAATMLTQCRSSMIP